MSIRQPALAMLALACALAAGGSTTASSAIEIPADGHPIAAASADHAPVVTGTPPAIFNPTPDWQNTLRRQVGGIAAGDLNGDGRPDLVAVCYQSSSFPPYEAWENFIHFNGEDGLEVEASWVSADQVHSGDVKIADIDGDGFPDLVVANGGSAYAPNSIYFGSATGPATTPGWTDAQPAWTNAIEVVDLDGDGWLDLVTANQGRGDPDSFRPMFAYRNNAGTLAGTPFWQSAEASIQNSLATADIDGDGDPDIASAKWVNFESAIYENLDGTPATAPVWTSGNTGTERGVALADFDGDGRPDVLIGVVNTLTLYRNNGDGTYTQTWSAGTTASHQDLLVADFDGDGRPDIVDIDFSTGRSYLYLNGPDGLDPTPVWSYDAPASGTALAAADFNGDGRLDLTVGYSGQPSLVVFYNQLEPVGEAEADLTLALHADPTTTPGAMLDLLIDVGNLGPDSASEVVVTLTLPPEFSFALDSDRPLPGQHTGGMSWLCASVGNNQLACDLSGNLAPETIAPPLEVTVDVAGDAALGTVEVSAEATSSANDPDPDNSRASIPVEIIGKDDLIFADGFEADTGPVECGWDTSLGSPGGALSSLGLWGNELYVGPSLAGPFGGVNNGVARIDLGSGTVSPLASTELVDGYVNAFLPYDAGDGEKLYVLGAFNGIRFAGSELPDSRAVVTWDGNTTATLTSPFTAAMSFAWTGTVFRDELVLGGSVGFPQTPLLAISDGAGWDAWSTQFEGLVAPIIMASAVYNDQLYIAGRFDRIRLPDDDDGEIEVESKNIMGFDGQDFFSVGGGVERSGNPVSQVMALAVFDGALYLGGRFNQSVTGMPLHSVAKWDGTTLSAVGAGFPTPIDVRDLVVHDDGSGETLYAVGTFTADTSGTPIRRLARLEAGEWVEVAGGVGANPGAGQSLPDGSLAVGGSFEEVGAKGVPGSGAANGLAIHRCAPAR